MSWSLHPENDPSFPSVSVGRDVPFSSERSLRGYSRLGESRTLKDLVIFLVVVLSYKRKTEQILEIGVSLSFNPRP